MAGVLTSHDPDPAAAPAARLEAAPGALSAEQARELRQRRTLAVSRSDRRTEVDQRKAERLREESRSGGQVTRTRELSSGDPREVARTLLDDYGFSADQFGCLDSLWTKESGWEVAADNPTSSAYGIPQALPGSKMATAGADWATNPVTQIRWGLGYIRSSYGTPCSAWAHSVSYNWY